MHEMSLVGDVVEVVERYAAAERASRVVSVSLCIGEMRDVVDRLLESCFAYLTRGTIAEGAELKVKKIPLKARCGECNTVFRVRLDPRKVPACPDCASRNLSIFTGGEFLIENIEIVDDSGHPVRDGNERQEA